MNKEIKEKAKEIALKYFKAGYLKLDVDATLKRATINYARLGYENLSIIQHDMESLPFSKDVELYAYACDAFEESVESFMRYCYDRKMAVFMSFLAQQVDFFSDKELQECKIALLDGHFCKLSSIKESIEDINTTIMDIMHDIEEYESQWQRILELIKEV